MGGQADAPCYCLITGGRSGGGRLKPYGRTPNPFRYCAKHDCGGEGKPAPTTPEPEAKKVEHAGQGRYQYPGKKFSEGVRVGLAIADDLRRTPAEPEVVYIEHLCSSCPDCGEGPRARVGPALPEESETE